MDRRFGSEAPPGSGCSAGCGDRRCTERPMGRRTSWFFSSLLLFVRIRGRRLREVRRIAPPSCAVRPPAGSGCRAAELQGCGFAHRCCPPAAGSCITARVCVVCGAAPVRRRTLPALQPVAVHPARWLLSAALWFPRCSPWFLPCLSYLSLQAVPGQVCRTPPAPGEIQAAAGQQNAAPTQ